MQVHKTVFSVYITCNHNQSVLYTGITNNLYQRIIEHYLDKDSKKTFAGKYNVYFLLYYEMHDYALNAIAREKEIKGWRREKKIALIKSFNPHIIFLNQEFFGAWPPKDMFHRKDLE